MQKWIVLAVGLAAAGPSLGQVYRCEANGSVSFQDRPCGDAEQSIFTTREMERRAALRASREEERRLQAEIARSWEVTRDARATERIRSAIMDDLNYRLYDPDSLNMDEWQPPEKGIPGYRQYVRYRARALAGGLRISEVMYHFDDEFNMLEAERLND